MSKQTERLVSFAGSFQNAAVIIANATAQRGGNLSEALVRLGTPAYTHEVENLAQVLARISRPLEYLESHTDTAGMVSILRDVAVDESLEWDAAIKSGFPEVPLIDTVWQEGNRFPAQRGARKKTMTLVLANFAQYYNHAYVQAALEWGKKHGLPPATPRTVLALGNHTERLRQKYPHRFGAYFEVASLVGRHGGDSYHEESFVGSFAKDKSCAAIRSIGWKRSPETCWLAFACESLEES